MTDPKETLSSMTAAGESPALSPDELDQLLELHARPDSSGATSGSEDWVPTYNLYAAASEGWYWKAGKCVSSSTSRSLDGNRNPDSWKYLNCIRQAEHYASRIVRSVHIEARQRRLPAAAQQFYRGGL